MFLETPHETTRRYTSLRERVGKEIFAKGQRLEPYYLAAYAAYKLDVNFRTGRINPKLKSARFQILLAMRYLANHDQLPQMNAKQMEKYCRKIIDILWDSNKADELCGEAAALVEEAAEGNLDRDNVRTQTFTERVIALSKGSGGQST
jgi:predicted transport protein